MNAENQDVNNCNNNNKGKKKNALVCPSDPQRHTSCHLTIMYPALDQTREQPFQTQPGIRGTPLRSVRAHQHLAKCKHTHIQEYGASIGRVKLSFKSGEESTPEKLEVHDGENGRHHRMFDGWGQGKWMPLTERDTAERETQAERYAPHAYTQSPQVKPSKDSRRQDISICPCHPR